jgi:CDP-diacylglycerol--glycerol-3-phosphate 3-phosphatidyltransferase/cardiolipin synthase
VVHYEPHWTGKASTVSQMFALGWVMLQIRIMPPLYPCCLAAVFTAWSGVNYILEGVRQLQQNPQSGPATSP